MANENEAQNAKNDDQVLPKPTQVADLMVSTPPVSSEAKETIGPRTLPRPTITRPAAMVIRNSGVSWQLLVAKTTWFEGHWSMQEDGRTYLVGHFDRLWVQATALPENDGELVLESAWEIDAVEAATWFVNHNAVVPKELKGIGPKKSVVASSFFLIAKETAGELLRPIERKLDQALHNREATTADAEFVSIKQAASVTGLSQSHVRRAVVSGELPASNNGSAQRPIYRVARSDLAAWMAKKKGEISNVPPSSELKDLIERHLPGLRGRKDSTTR